MDYKFIDTYCGIDKRYQCVTGVDYSAESLKNALCSVNVKKAFCFHYGISVGGDFYENRVMKEAISGDEFFLPAYSLLINNGRINGTDEFEKILKEDNIRVMNIPQTGCLSSLSMFTLSDYFDIMDELKITIGIPCTLIHEDLLAEILKKYKNVNIISRNMSFSNVLNIRKLINKFDNFFIDTSYSCITGIEKLVKSFGSEKIVYASYAPENAPMTFAGRIILSSVTREEKDKIAYKNIMRMTGEVLI